MCASYFKLELMSAATELLMQQHMCRLAIDAGIHPHPMHSKDGAPAVHATYSLLAAKPTIHSSSFATLLCAAPVRPADMLANMGLLLLDYVLSGSACIHIPGVELSLLVLGAGQCVCRLGEL